MSTNTTILLLLSGTARVYNAVTHSCVVRLQGHTGEISKVHSTLTMIVTNCLEPFSSSNRSPTILRVLLYSLLVVTRQLDCGTLCLGTVCRLAHLASPPHTSLSHSHSVWMVTRMRYSVVHSTTQETLLLQVCATPS